MSASAKVLLTALLGLTAAACESGGYYAEAMPAASMDEMARAGSGNSGYTVALDDVTNGLQDSSSLGLDNVGRAAPSTNPLAGAFFDDGRDGDIRGGRVENYFGEALKSVDGKPTAQEPSGTRRMLICNGEISIEVSKPDVAIAAFLEKVMAWGGYLQAQSDKAITVRLPATRFDDAFAALREAGRVLHEHRKADDVTEEFVDLGIRIDTARKSRERLLEVLKEAKEVADVLAVEKELRRLTEEIERMEGRRKFLADRVAMATMQAIFQATSEPPPPPQKRRQPSRFSWINMVGAEQLMRNF